MLRINNVIPIEVNPKNEQWFRKKTENIFVVLANHFVTVIFKMELKERGIRGNLILSHKNYTAVKVSNLKCI